ncbi:chitin synthase-domain-containing protein [Gaertneriomyces semiglobifer]|nr:chitin synthase-domain-containing protein [Gaertneriomyces semiglobifer]
MPLQEDRFQEEESSDDSLTSLTELVSPTVDHIARTLRKRYRNGNYFTKLGENTLLAVGSPALALSCAPDVGTTYAKWAVDVSENKEMLPPHIFDMAASCFYHMARDAENQSITFFGGDESGKCEIRKLFVRQLLLLSTVPEDIQYQRTLVAATLMDTVFDAFANARTVRGRNATQICRYVEYQYDDLWRLIGVGTIAHHLDTRRISHAHGGKNDTFPIFQYMLAGLKPEEKTQWKLGEGSSFKYLQENPFFHSAADDKYMFHEVQKALKNLRIGFNVQKQLFQVLAAILHLGNITFADDTLNPNNPCSVSNGDELVTTATLLGVDPGRLEEALVYKFRVIGSQHVSMFMNSRQAAAHRDLVAATMYQKLFAWMVRKMNACLCKNYADEVNAAIRVLDIPGYRDEKPNSIDGLLYNMSNEQLHHFATVWSHERCQLYSQEGVLSFAVTTEESRLTAIAHLIAPDAGLLDLINAESINWLSGDDKEDGSAQPLPPSITSTYELVTRDAEDHVQTSCLGFRIEHFHGAVAYDFSRIADSNLEVLSTASTSIFTGNGRAAPPCANGFIRNLFFDGFEDVVEPTAIIPNFAETSNRIVGAMKDGLPWFVLCLDSGDSGLDNKCDPVTLKAEISNYQVTHQVQIRMAGDYIADYSHEDFINRFHAVILGQSQVTDEIDFTALCEEFAATMGWSEDTMGLGLERVFLTERAWRFLHDRLRAHEHETHQQTWNPRIGDAVPDFAKGFPDNMTDIDSDGDPTSTMDADIRYISTQEKEKEQLLIPEKEEKRPRTAARSRWLCCTWSLTWCCLPFCLSTCGRLRRKEVQMAWREKVALCLIILLMCIILLGFIIGLPLLLCVKQKVLSIDEVRHQATTRNVWAYGFGKAYDLNALAKGHDNIGVDMNTFRSLSGKHIANMFYPVDLWDQSCPGIAAPSVAWDNIPRRPVAPDLRHRSPGVNYFDSLSKAAKFDIAFHWDYIQQQTRLNRTWIVLYEKVYDVSTYKESEFFQQPLISKIFQQLQGTDATAEWETAVPSAERAAIMSCMDRLFLMGVVDHRLDPGCQFANYILLASSILIILVIGTKFLVAVQFTSAPRVNPSSLDRFVICQIPCYTESAASLRKSLESLAITDYEDLRKLLFVICDGMVVGTGNTRPTPQIVLDILGVDPKTHAEPLAFQSVGEGDMQFNRAKIYSGLYTVERKGVSHTVPFIVVVKVGKQTELVRPGNRGKRDSQLLLMQFLSRVHQNAEMTPLELELYRHMAEVIGIHPSMYELMLMVDADTEVAPNSLTQMVHAMMHDKSIIGLCGETVLANANRSWVTRIQVYEYFISHHLTKAFESIFGAVTCLPGCFCIYRILSEKGPMLISSKLIDDFKENQIDTLHLKNLFQLGEDRFLTTLVMKHFPHMRTVFNTHAKCKTIAPDKWKILLSQRRRWINSTVHNLFELLFIRRLCGFFCCSMRFVVFLDLLSTLIQPAAVVYIAYLIYVIVSQTSSFPVISLALLAAIYGLQIIVFVLKRELKQMIFMFVYIFAIPIFTCYLPLYSFWHFDDFSWGNTRIVYGEHGKKTTQVADVGKFDPNSIPKCRWEDFQQKKAAEVLEASKEKGDKSSSGWRLSQRPVANQAGRSSVVNQRRDSGMIKSYTGSSGNLPEFSGSKVPSPRSVVDASFRRSGYDEQSVNLGLTGRRMSPAGLGGDGFVGPFRGVGVRSTMTPPPPMAPEYPHTRQLSNNRAMDYFSLPVAPSGHPSMGYNAVPTSPLNPNGNMEMSTRGARPVSYDAIFTPCQPPDYVPTVYYPQLYSGFPHSELAVVDPQSYPAPAIHQPCAHIGANDIPLTRSPGLDTRNDLYGVAPSPKSGSPPFPEQVQLNAGASPARHIVVPVPMVRDSPRKGSQTPSHNLGSNDVASSTSSSSQHRTASPSLGGSAPVRPVFPMPHPMERRASEIRLSGFIRKRSPTGDTDSDDSVPGAAALATHRGSWRSGAPEAVAAEDHQFPSNADILLTVRQFVQCSDLMAITKRDIREQVARHFGVSMETKRQLINDYIHELLGGAGSEARYS